MRDDHSRLQVASGKIGRRSSFRSTDQHGISRQVSRPMSGGRRGFARRASPPSVRATARCSGNTQIGETFRGFSLALVIRPVEPSAERWAALSVARSAEQLAHRPPQHRTASDWESIRRPNATPGHAGRLQRDRIVAPLVMSNTCRRGSGDGHGRRRTWPLRIACGCWWMRSRL